MMGRLNHEQEQFFYSFRLDEAVPEDHPVREIAAVLDLSWVHSELAPYYPRLGRPSIDPVLMIRMLIVGYVFGIRSERALCRILEDALDDAWRRVESSKAPWASEEYSTAGRTILARYIITMAKGGERDAKWLADGALLYLSQQKLTRTPPEAV